MKKIKVRAIFVLLIILGICFLGYKALKKKTATNTTANVNNREVSMPYINPEWEEYMELSDEEKEILKKAISNCSKNEEFKNRLSELS